MQLSPADAQALRGLDDLGAEDADGESEFGVDTEFRGIFSIDDADQDTGVGTASSVDFDLGTDLGDSDDAGSPVLDDLEQTQFSLRDVPPLDSDSNDDDEGHTLVLGRGASGEVDELQTKLDLAQAYMDMGDNEGARNLLGEVMADGGDEQQSQAQEMLSRLT